VGKKIYCLLHYLRLDNEATTLYENWKINAGSFISLKHIMFGEIGAWVYKGIGGLKPDA